MSRFYISKYQSNFRVFSQTTASVKRTEDTKTHSSELYGSLERPTFIEKHSLVFQAFFPFG